jgi:hypothetical protein
MMICCDNNVGNELNAHNADGATTRWWLTAISMIECLWSTSE